MDSVTLTNSDLGIVSGDLPIAKLAPGQSELVTFKSTIAADLVNSVKVEANPVYNNGDDIEGVPDVGARDHQKWLRLIKLQILTSTTLSTLVKTELTLAHRRELKWSEDSKIRL